jgi:RNA polymerase sigma-70 factor (ECF subfamily)
LLSLIEEKDRQALEALYARYSGPVFSLAMQMLRDAGAAEEVTQDAFFNVWRRAASYRSDRGKVTAWLFSIAHHRVIDEVRRRKRREQAQSSQDVDLLSQPADDSGDPARFAIGQMRRSEIKEALSGLRPEQRDVVILAYYGGLTHSEIAKKLDQPLGTVKTRMRLALKKLRDIMGPQAREWA